MIDLLTVRMEIPEEANIIIGQSHFIKTVEDIYEAVVTTAPHARFGLAFNESPGACLIRSDGNDPVLRDAAIRNAQALAAGPCLASSMGARRRELRERRKWRGGTTSCASSATSDRRLDAERL